MFKGLTLREGNGAGPPAAAPLLGLEGRAGVPWLFPAPIRSSRPAAGKPVTQDVGGLEPVIAMPLDVAPVDTADRHNLAGMELLPWINHELGGTPLLPGRTWACQPGVKGPGEPVPLRGSASALRSATVTGRYRLSMPAAATGCDAGFSRAWWAVPACSSPAGSTPRAGILPSEWPPTRSFDRRGSAHPTPPGLVLRRSGARGLPDGFARVRIGSCLELVQHLAIDAVPPAS